MPSLNDRERATILAALRYWQREAWRMDTDAEWKVATDEGRLEALSKNEIDALCEKLNTKEA